MCLETCDEIEMAKAHSTLDEKIDENKIDEDSRSNLSEQHFAEEKYFPKYNICNQVIYSAHKNSTVYSLQFKKSSAKKIFISKKAIRKYSV